MPLSDGGHSMSRSRATRSLISLAAGPAAVLAFAPAAEAHGLVGRTDLPIPEWLFGWAGTAVLVISFVTRTGRMSSQTGWPRAAHSGTIADLRAVAIGDPDEASY